MDYTSVTASVDSFGQQVKAGWTSVSAFTLDTEMISSIIVCGMGGSALGARIVSSYTTKIPIHIVTDYSIPDFADNNTLIVLSSYSGTTEETLACFEEALEKNLPTFVITTGGELAERAKEKNLPLYIIDPKENPSGQPRLATGYSIGALFAIVSKIYPEVVSEEEILHALEFVSPKESAREIAVSLHNQGVILVASNHLIGPVHASKNMINETAKSFAALFDIPELNHHLMEGLSHPEELKKHLTFLFFESDQYYSRIGVRYQITKEVVEKNGYSYVSFAPKSETKLGQVFETIAFGGYLQIALGEYYDVDPVAIPWVDYFKDKLKK